MSATLERVARDVWAYHYRIAPLAYLGAGFAALLVAILVPLQGDPLLVAIFAAALAAQGLVRWWVVRRRCRFALVVPLFQEGPGAEGRAREVQTLVIDHLRRHLPSRFRDFVQPIPTTMTSAEDDLAAKLQTRLRAMFVLHGRIAAQPDGAWSVYPRVLEPAVRSVTHWDRFTRDVTPATARFGPVVSSLPATVGVRDEEFPLDFCRDLEAVMQGIAGQAAAAVNQHSEAEKLLDQALAKAQESTNHQIDALRVSRAFALAAQDRRDEAIDFLRDRLRSPDPSPHLLRGLALLLTDRSWDDWSTADQDQREAIEALRSALQDETDPQWDMTAYNLCVQIERGPEHYRLLGRLLAHASTYRRLWYVRQLEAIRHWIKVEEARAAESLPDVRRHGKAAAKWYGRTLRARPRVQYLLVSRRSPFVRFKRIEASPILYANTKDAHQAAGHKLRERYFEWRFQRIRQRHLKIADRHLRAAEWNLAYAHFDWASSVGRHDGVEHRALAFAACCCWKGGRTRDGDAKWREAAQHHPDCLIGRALMVRQLKALGLDPSVPGHEPDDIDGTVEYISKRFPGWAWHTDGEFISPEEFARLEGVQGDEAP
jgi:tetratricopeptide (TPR) repeat protein